MTADLKPLLSYHLTDHACRHCGARVLQSGLTFRCSTCGMTCRDKPTGICGCGILPREHPKGLNDRSKSPFHCGPNPKPTAQSPAEVIILFGDAPAAAPPP